MTTNQGLGAITQTIGQMSEAQSNSYEALAENIEAFQRRNMDFAQGGLEFLRLQESNARAVQEWWTIGLKLLQLQQHNISFAQNWLSSGIGALRDQTEQNGGTAEVFVQSVRKQQEGLRNLSEGFAGGFAGTYQNLFFSPFGYAQALLRTAEQATQQGLQATHQATEQGLQLAVEASEQTEQVIQEAEQVVQEAEQAIEEAELEVAVLSALGSENYDELTVADISKKLENFSTEDLEKLRAYEKQNKNRETLIDQIDRKIKSATE